MRLLQFPKVRWSRGELDRTPSPDRLTDRFRTPTPGPPSPSHAGPGRCRVFLQAQGALRHVVPSGSHVLISTCDALLHIGGAHVRTPCFLRRGPPEPPGALQELTMATVTGSRYGFGACSPPPTATKPKVRGSCLGATPVRMAGRRVDDVSRTFCQPEYRWNGYAAKGGSDGGGWILV